MGSEYNEGTRSANGSRQGYRRDLDGGESGYRSRKTQASSAPYSSRSRGGGGMIMHPDVLRARRARLAELPDVINIRSKMEDVASKWDIIKNGPLLGFDCVSMGPTEFRELIKRNFMVVLSARELGALVAWYDRTGEGRADCNEFIKDFWQVGRAEKARKQAELAKISVKINKRMREKRQAKIDHMAAIREVEIGPFSPEDRERALKKVAHVAAFYNVDRHGPLTSLSEGCGMSPATFKEQLKANFGLRLTRQELSAVVKEFDKDGDGTIDGPEFMYRFQYLGRQERLARLQARRRADEAQIKKRQKVNATIVNKLGACLSTKVNYNFTDEVRDRAMAKIAKEAGFYDRDRNIGLENVVCGSLDPTGFRTQLRQTFGIRVTSMELGALFNAFDLDGSGTIEGAEFLNYFFRLGREERGRRIANAEKARRKHGAALDAFNRNLREKYEKQITAKVQWPDLPDDPFEPFKRANGALSSRRPEDEDANTQNDAESGYRTPNGRSKQNMSASVNNNSVQNNESIHNGSMRSVGGMPSVMSSIESGRPGSSLQGGGDSDQLLLPKISAATATFLKELAKAELRVKTMHIKHEKAGKVQEQGDSTSGLKKVAGQGRVNGADAPKRKKKRKKKRTAPEIEPVSPSQSQPGEASLQLLLADERLLSPEGGGMGSPSRLESNVSPTQGSRVSTAGGYGEDDFEEEGGGHTPTGED